MSFGNDCNGNNMLKKDKDKYVLVLVILSIGKSIEWGVINEKDIRFKYFRKIFYCQTKRVEMQSVQSQNLTKLNAVDI